MNELNLTRENFEDIVEKLSPEHKDYLFSDHVTEKSFNLSEKLDLSDEANKKWGLLIGFYLAGKIPDDKLASVIEEELSTDAETAEKYADAIIEEFASDREIPKENQSETPTRVPLAEELLKVAGTQNRTTPVHPNTTQLPPARQDSTPVPRSFSEVGGQAPTNLPTQPVAKPSIPTPETPKEHGLDGRPRQAFQIEKPTNKPETKPLDAEIMDHFNKPPVVDPKKTQGRVENMGPAQNFSADNKKVVTNPFSDQGGAPQEEKVVPDNKMPPIVKPVTIPGNAVVPPFERQAEAEKTEPPHIEQEHNPTIDSANETSTQSYKGNDPYREPIN